MLPELFGPPVMDRLLALFLFFSSILLWKSMEWWLTPPSGEVRSCHQCRSVSQCSPGRDRPSRARRRWQLGFR